jgi:hypothetical protein
MRFSSIVCASIVAACAVGSASAETSVDLPATGSTLPLVGWLAVLLIMVGTAVTVYRMLRGASPPTRPKRRVNGKIAQAR